MSVDLIIDGCPPWAALAGASGDASPQPASPAGTPPGVQSDCTLRAHGVSMFEIWNEPNLEKFWQPKPNPVAYTADLVAAYRAIKEGIPRPSSSPGGCPRPQLTGPTSAPSTSSPPCTPTAPRAASMRSATTPTAIPSFRTPRALVGLVPDGPDEPFYPSVMTSNGDSSKPVWITEVGAPSSGPGGVGQAAQATQFTQLIADAQQTKWVGGLYLYSWQDDGTDQSNKEDWFGLVTAAGSQKPAYAAVKSALK